MERNKLSVSQLNNYIKGVFDDELILKNITVFGEVSEKSEAAGNLYMTLSDSGSILVASVSVRAKVRESEKRFW